jgi:hypothetical protein
MSTSEANWDANIADAKLLGQHWTGSGGFASPGIGSYENTLATAATLNRLGERSVKNGTGPIARAPPGCTSQPARRTARP